MKNIITASLIAALGGLAVAPQASAKNDGAAILGGFIGGVLVGSAIQQSNHHSDYHTDYRSDYAPSAPVCTPPAVVRYAPPPPRGYWQAVTVKTWVPPHWVRRVDGYGRPVRILEQGYYTYSTERVWVNRG